MADQLPYPRAAAIAEVMLRTPHVLGSSSTAAQVGEFFADDHVHVALIVDGRRLISVVGRADLDGQAETTPAGDLGTLRGRTVRLDADLQSIQVWMIEAGIRRLAVVDHDQQLHGLLCLKRSGNGFCTDTGVAARREERTR